jgi:hypothetical protein
MGDKEQRFNVFGCLLDDHSPAGEAYYVRASDFDRLRREREKAEAREQRVQRALAFWHPGVRIDDVPEAATERAADDAMLLFGLDEADEQSAVDLGWIAWVVPGGFAALRRELAEAREDADTYRQERNDISENYTRLECQLAEARELLRAAVNEMECVIDCENLSDGLPSYIPTSGNCIRCRVNAFLDAAMPAP